MKLIMKMYVCLSALLLASCSLIDIKKQSEQLENLAFISGSIESQDDKHPIYVGLLKKHESYIELMNQTLLDASNEYQFTVIPGTYMLAAFIWNGKRSIGCKSIAYCY